MSTTAVTARNLTRGDEGPAAVQGLINGEWLEGQGAVKDTINPATGKVVSRVAFSSPDQVEEAVAAARDAQPAWAKTSVAARARFLHAAMDEVEAHADEICRWISLEMGKTLSEARDEVIDEITLPVGRMFIEDARRFGGSTPPAWSESYPSRRVQTLYQPIGVTSFISPWNFPVEMIVNVVSSLMMGNACVWKPSEWAPYGPQLLTEAFVSAGLPDGLVNLVYGGPEIGEGLVTHDGVGLVCFIGSTAVGERIARVAGVKRVLLELGGNGPMIVLDDADVDAAVESAASDCFYQAGQVCTAGERLIVQQGIHDEFVEKLTAAAQTIRMGDPLDESTDMGPLSDKRILDKVVHHVEDARSRGAAILTGGSRRGLFFEPTVLANVTPAMEIAREETFGPVAPVIKVDSLEEALRVANDSPYGLSTAVFTSSLERAFEASEGLEAGSVNVNAGTNDWEMSGPFGGWKKSGIGRELGEHGMREFTNAKTVTFNLS